MASTLLPIGVPAPVFDILMPDGTAWPTSYFQGKKRLVLVFYPGDFTPICTAQLCLLRDHWNQLLEHDALVVGINPAKPSKHRLFAEKFAFPFPLISDQGHKIAKAYGCCSWFGINRRTVYIVDKKGLIAYACRGNPNIAELLQVLRSLHDEPPYASAHNGMVSTHTAQIPDP
ncbi:Peroxiredoxin [Chthonomonas calidirosea]|uniref:thioredoxin-dependent peroxiredoxin n=1 Tax=Chthonomonas calidirosea (strain DSM 23976 / ICMP 18418 / T49) TaxID=1303518 RepID=S0ESB4_CHTCT|nr:redoxin domain-containing protein [Chthonomonas calidirosea]CCW34101.1 Peroxiredoxin [Chthonomonas calidirosea T49]CEK15755.1 Peroxiredoxin [Chthonomonas calidirosea]